MRPEPADQRERAVERRGFRHNALMLGGDLALFMTGMALMSPSTILPAFAVHLGASNLVIGAIPAVMALGWSLPALFAAGHTETLPRKLPFVLRWSLWERLPVPMLALAAFFLATPAPGLAVALLLAMLLAITGIGGVLMPAWMDLVGRSIPTTVRGRFFAAAHVVGNLCGLAGSALTAWILAAMAPPASFGVCFLAATVVMALSFWALTRTREVAMETTTPARPLRDYLARIPALLRSDRNLIWFLAARMCAVTGAMGAAFFTVYALRAHGAEGWHVGFFTTLMLTGHIAGSLALGWLGDHFGHRLVIVLGTGAMLAANALAIVAPGLATFQLVFVAAGAHQASISVSNMNILLDFAPVPEERPTYVGLGSTVMAPVALLTPLAAGLLADVVGFEGVFAVAAGFGALALAVLLGRVREPRPAVSSRG